MSVRIGTSLGAAGAPGVFGAAVALLEAEGHRTTDVVSSKGSFLTMQDAAVGPLPVRQSFEDFVAGFTRELAPRRT